MNMTQQARARRSIYPRELYAKNKERRQQLQSECWDRVFRNANKNQNRKRGERT